MILVRILFFGILLFGVHPSKAQEIDSSYIGTYAIVLNNLQFDTVGYIAITSKTYTYVHKGSDQLEYNRTFMNTSSGDYSIKNHSNTNETDTMNYYTIDFDPKNIDRNWRQLLHSTLGLRGGNGNWYLNDNTSRSFPQYRFYKIE